MQPGQTKLLRFVYTWAINSLAVAVAAAILHGHITYENWQYLLLASLLLGLLNAFVRPILILLALPFVIFTLGLFTLVINAVLLWVYSLSCHACRHVTGGRLKHFSKHPVRYWMWTQVSKLNVRHMQ